MGEIYNPAISLFPDAEGYGLPLALFFNEKFAGRGRPTYRFDVLTIQRIGDKLGIPRINVVGKPRQVVIDYYASHPLAIRFGAEIGQLMSVADKVPEDVKDSNPRAQRLIELARRHTSRAWEDILLEYTPAQVEAVYNTVDRYVYGDYVLIVDLRLHDDHNKTFFTRPNLPVRAKTQTPTRDELIEAVKFANDSRMDDGYTVRLRETDGLRDRNISIEVKAVIPIESNFNYAERAHFGSVLEYASISDVFAPIDLEGMIKNDTDGKCGYQIVSEDLDMKYEEIARMLEKKQEDGMTAPDLIKLYKSRNVAAYLFDLGDAIIDSYIVENTSRNHADSGERVFVLILANQHVYRPNPATRDRLLKKTQDKRLKDPDDDGDSGEQKEDEDRPGAAREQKIIRAETFEEAMREASRQASYNYIRDERNIKQYYDHEIKLVDKEIEEKATQYVPSAKKQKGSSKKEFLKDLTAKRAALCAESERKIKELRNADEKVPVTNIYVKMEDMKEPYYDMILNKGVVFASDISDTENVYHIRYAEMVNIFANTDYEALKETAEALGVRYINQSVPSLARAAFKDVKHDEGWDSSIFNNSARALMEQFPPEALNYVKTAWGLLPGDDGGCANEIAAVDFYRHYASTAMRGDFYYVPFIADVEPMRGLAVDERPALYYVETGEELLFGGNGVYDYKVVLYGLAAGLIAPENVRLRILCVASKKIDKTLGGFIKYVYARVKNAQHRKDIVNTLIGSMQTMHRMKRRKTFITDSLADASYYFNTTGATHKIVRPIGERMGKKIYLTSAHDTLFKQHTNELVRRAVIQRSRMEVYDLSVKVAQRFEVIGVKTDAVYYVKPKGAKPYETKNAPHTFGDTRQEVVKDAARACLPIEPRVCRDVFDFKSQEWREPLGELSETDYFDAKRLLTLNRAFIKGFAGSGKSTVLCALKEELERAGKVVCPIAFTNAAAQIVDGVTMHKFFGVNKEDRADEASMKRAIFNTDAILIDEVSMVPGTLWAILAQLPETVGIYGFGDFRQHRPVEKDARTGRLYVDTTMFRGMFNYNMVVQRKSCRSDRAYADECIHFFDMAQMHGYDNALNAFMPLGVKESKGEHKIELPARNICFTNHKRREINSKVMRAVNKTLCKPIDRVFKGYERDEAKYVYKWEHYDARKLVYVITHPAEFADIAKKASKWCNEDPMTLATKYLANSIIDEEGQGHKLVKYFKCQKGRGRWIPALSQSLAYITRALRHIIANERYYDIDMVNCHPTILRQLCARMGVDTPRLNEYVDDRDKVFRAVMKGCHTDKEMAKKVILALINGGKADYMQIKGYKCKWLCEFHAETLRIQTAFLEKHGSELPRFIERRREAQKYKGADDGSFVNMFLIDEEVRMLDVMVNRMRKLGLLGEGGDDVVMCADGMMVKRDERVTAELMDELAEEIKRETGLIMRLVIKPMEHAARELKHLAGVDVQPKKRDEWAEYMDPELWDEFECLAVGMPVIACRNRERRGFFNNQMFKIGHIGAAGVGLEREGFATIYVSEDMLRRDFKPAYCTTSHKAQGATIRGAYGVHEIDKMDEHGAYVALTRAQKAEDVIIYA